MRYLYLSTTACFWLLVMAFWAGSLRAPSAEKHSVVAADRLVVPAELARHARPEDCWMAIRGSAYDLSTYLPEHPSRPEVVQPWCGREASEAYNTKNKGRPHSPHADELLVKYRIGAMASDKP